MAEYARRGERIVRELAGIEGIEARVLWDDPRGRPVVPRVYIDFHQGFRLTKEQARQQMLDGEPGIVIGETSEGLMIAVLLLNDEEVGVVARRLREVLGNQSS